MSLTNTKTSYGSVSRLFHWAIAAIYIGLFYVAYTMMDMPNSPEKFGLYGWHKSFGVLVFILALARIIWRWSNPVPQAEPGTQSWQYHCAQLAHYGLYALMLAMPLSGYIMSTVGGHDVSLFGLKLPSLLAQDPSLMGTARQAHTLLSQAIMGLVGVHVLAGLWHHLVRKDRTLTRMIKG